MSLITNIIYNEDCLQTLKKMPNDSIDLIVTSPPYNMNLRISKGRYTSRQIVKELSTKYDGFDDNLPTEDYYLLHKKILEECIRVGKLVFYNIAIVTGSKRAWFKIMGDLSDYLKDIIVWDKQHGQPAMQQQVLNRRTELLLIFEKDYPISRQFRLKGRFARGTLDDIWLIPRQRNTTNGTYHGAIFPEALVEKIILNFSDERDIVYDPFLGTGTTCIVAKNHNRQFIGSEISEIYYNIAAKRINL
jgi:site-specific DNA-methyltransferase (adenine-specific)